METWGHDSKLAAGELVFSSRRDCVYWFLELLLVREDNDHVFRTASYLKCNDGRPERRRANVSTMESQ